MPLNATPSADRDRAEKLDQAAEGTTSPRVVPLRRPATRARGWLAAALVAGLAIEAGAHAIEWASTRTSIEPIRRRSAILREQSERIAMQLDTTRSGRLEIDTLLGWRYRPGHFSETDHLNDYGLRAEREYELVPAPGTLRIAAFGDSFVYGNEVADADAWCAVLETIGTGLEVLNYGVGGYGLDQAYIRFQREGMALRPDVVLIGFAPDDLRRMVNVYRRFISSLEWPLGKPRFVLRPDGTLTLVPNPLARREDYERLLARPAEVSALGALDSWYSPTVYEHPLYDVFAILRVGHAVSERLRRRYFDPDRLLRRGVFHPHSSAFVLQVAVLRAFADSVRAGNAEAVILMLPDRPSLERSRRGIPPVYAPLRDALLAHGLTVWDGERAFRSTNGPIDELFAPGGHYSPDGNRALAAWLARELDGVRVPRLASALPSARR